MRRLMMLLGLSAIAACSGGSSEPVDAVRHEVFAGTWRSVTPNMEFLRLIVESKSSERDVLAARLTFSGVYWEGSGKVDGDSLVLNMTVLGRGDDARTMVARLDRDGTLRTVAKSTTATPLSVDFVRDY